MEFNSVTRGRRSIRAHSGEAASEQLIRQIRDETRWAPSCRNTQAWNVWVTTGDAPRR